MNRWTLLAAFIGGLACVPVLWSRTEIGDASQPQLAVSSEGTVWLCYGRAGDVLIARSDDGGATFDAATKVATVPKLMLGMRRGPRLVAHGDRLTVTVIAHELLAFVSDDRGKTWSLPTAINEVGNSAREGLHDLASDRDGRVFVTWLDLRSGTTELWGAFSSDGGRSWTKNERIYRSADKTICECCHPSALYDAQGNLAVLWRNAVRGSRDMWMTLRAKGTESFSSPRKLGEGTWKLDACPMDGGELVAGVDEKGFGAVWQRAGEVFWSTGIGPEVSLGAGRQPVAAMVGSEPVFLWQRGNNLLLARGTERREPTVLEKNSRFPSIVLLPGGTRAVIAYERPASKGNAASIVVQPL